MSKQLSFNINELFKQHADRNEFWRTMYQKFKIHENVDTWPIIQRSEHVIPELISFLENNGIYDLLQKDEETITIVLQERKVYSGSTFKLTDRVKVIVPKSSWYVQRTAPEAGYVRVEGKWTELPLTNTSAYAYPGPNGEPILWLDYPGNHGVRITERFNPGKENLIPSPITLGDLPRG